MAAEDAKTDISAADGAAIVKQAATWKGTPYALIGASSAKVTGGDCSGSTWLIYKDAEFPYDYQATATFPEYVRKTGRFRELKDGEARQEGDLLLWPNHMAIYSSFASDADNRVTNRTNKHGNPWKQMNDMWTASRPGGSPYGPAEMRWWRSDTPKTLRYVK